jgi:putative transposase
LADYDHYIEPIAETFAWCLMKNHLHLLVRIKNEEEIGYFVPNEENASGSSRRWKVAKPSDLPVSEAPESVTPLKKPTPTNQFSHLFNAYAKAFNSKYDRKGSLFIKRFKRKRVDNIHYLKTLILYIHNNPVHHGFCSHPIEYPWSSYLTCISVKPTKLHREKVMGWFDDKANFRQQHDNKLDIDDIENWLEL